MKSDRVYVSVLVDHESTEDPQTLVQMLGYIVRIWEKGLSNDQPLVPVLSWAIYNGIGPRRAARSSSEWIPVPEPWRRDVPALELSILGVGPMEDSAMTGHPNL